MNKQFFLLLQVFTVLFIWAPPGQASPDFSEPIPAAELIQAIQSGGHILYMRHGPTDHSRKSSDRHDLQDCNSQRNLSAQGRELMKRIGVIVDKLEIPVAGVSSSPYCRCRDTAELVFGDYVVEPNLRFSISKGRDESAELGNLLRGMMMDADTGDGNVVFVGHTSNLRDGLGVWPKPEGVVVVFQKRKNELVYKGMIMPESWPEL